MRLIDADAINPMRCPRSIAEMRDWIDEQPTAYDVDKVVEEINEESWEYMSDFGDTRVIDFADVIDIVRRGGVDA